MLASKATLQITSAPTTTSAGSTRLVMNVALEVPVGRGGAGGSVKHVLIGALLTLAALLANSCGPMCGGGGTRGESVATVTTTPEIHSIPRSHPAVWQLSPPHGAVAPAGMAACQGGVAMLHWPGPPRPAPPHPRRSYVHDGHPTLVALRPCVSGPPHLHGEAREARRRYGHRQKKALPRDF